MMRDRTVQRRTTPRLCVLLASAASGLLGLGAPARASFVIVNYGTNNPTALSIAGYSQSFDSLPAGTGGGASLGSSPAGGWYPETPSGSGNYQPRLAGWDIFHSVSQATEGGQTGNDRFRVASAPSSTGSFYSLG